MTATKEDIQKHLMGAINIAIMQGAPPDQVAAFLVGQIVYMFKESGWTDERVMHIVENTLEHWPKPH